MFSQVNKPVFICGYIGSPSEVGIEEICGHLGIISIIPVGPNFGMLKKTDRNSYYP
jgi:hypothetical protein